MPGKGFGSKEFEAFSFCCVNIAEKNENNTSCTMSFERIALRFLHEKR